ncbi:MAG: hypothetical protein II799_05635, partial [Lachnospiraceae bacterium]|nr:hypothetical protein [Lachnospiraceae bacterium]
TSMDQIKAKLAQSGTVIAGFNDDLGEADIEAVSGDSMTVSAGSIERALKAKDLPYTHSNEQQLQEVLDMARGLSDVKSEGLSDQSIAFMINNELDPTLYNVFRARMSAGSYVIPDMEADNGQLARLSDQIDAVITGSGHEVNPQTEADATTLLKNDIPLTSENFGLYEELKGLKIPDEEALLDLGAQALSDGKRAVELSLIRQERQLYEAQLQMTSEANRLLLKSDFYIDTQELIAQVDSLKQLEESLTERYAGQSFEGMEALLGSEESAPQIYMQTMVKAAVMDYLPVDTVADLAQEPLTLNGFYKKGMDRVADYEKARESYETLGTEVRRDLGDSIKKAFGNVDDILKDLGLDMNESNRRAVRILGYNSTQINDENIAKMREADAKIQGVMERLTPGAVLKMIRAGENPLDMSIEQLSAILDEHNDPQDTINESYARFLVKLEHNNAVSESEKESFIGIYRLFRQVEKSDGAVIGSLINQGADLSVRNLVTAIRNSKMQGGMEYTVDDDFGGMEKVIPEGIKRIDAQIMSAFSSPEYYTQKNRQILEDLEPGHLKAALDSGELSMESDLEGVWDISIKILSSPEDEAARQAAAQEEAQFYRDAMDSDETVLRALESSGVQADPAALSAMKNLIYNRGDVFKRLSEMGRQLRIADMIEDFETEDGAKKAIEDLADDAKQDIDAAMEMQDMTSAKLRGLMLMNDQVSLIKEMAGSEHYEIPVEIDGELTAISLKVIKGTGKSSVEIATQTEEYGPFKVTFKPDGDDINGYMIARTAYGEEYLKEKLTQLREAFAGINENLSDKFGVMRNPQLVLTSADVSDGGSERVTDVQAGEDISADERISSQRLYRMAKAFLQVIGK